jgi:hypothetical protein
VQVIRVRIEVSRNPMTRIVFVMIALMLLLPILYVIFFTPFIPFLLRKMKLVRSTSDVKIQINDTKPESDVIIPDEVITPPKK